MSIEKKLDVLNRISKVETPPFLFTRIRARIHDLDAPVSLVWKMVFAALVVIVLFINITILGTVKPIENNAAQVFSSMQLSSSNDIYDQD